MPFKPGVSGNPGGRPKGRRKIPAFVAKFRALEPAAMQFVADLLGGKIKGGTISDRRWAVELAMAYSRGKPKLGVEHSGPNGDAIPLSVSSGDLLAQLERLAKDGEGG